MLLLRTGKPLLTVWPTIELNPVRADLVERPEDYRWCNLGYHVQTGNYGSLLSLDFGLREFGEMSDEERFRMYRKFVYETGSVAHPEKPDAKVIDKKF